MRSTLVRSSLLAFILCLTTPAFGTDGNHCEALRCFGDLDADGRADVAVVASRPGAREAVFVLVFAQRSGAGWMPMGTVRLEDGAAVDRLRIVAGRLTIAYRRPFPIDPACCPSEETVRSFAVVDGLLHGAEPRAPDGLVVEGETFGLPAAGPRS